VEALEFILTLLTLSAMLPLRIGGGSSGDMEVEADMEGDWESERDGAFERDSGDCDEAGVDWVGALGGGRGPEAEFMLMDEVSSLLRRDSLAE
jgi:hypothetical protein